MINDMNPLEAVRRAGRLAGTFAPPGDKSISHRALILAALARGRSRISGLNPGDDVASTRRVLQNLGVSIAPDGAQWVVEGVDGRLSEPSDVLDCGNSGTTMRLLAGVVAATPGLFVLTGDESLRRRPMRRVADPLGRMGARIWLRGGEFAPLAVAGGRLQPAPVPESVTSAQVKSALLLAGALGAGRTTVIELSPSRDHTERLLEFFGAGVERQGRSVALSGPVALGGRDFGVPGDPSAAIFALTAALLIDGSEVTAERVGINPTRRTGFDLLRRMGADLVIDSAPDQAGTEPVGRITARAGRLRSVEIAGDEARLAIDELPILAVAACAAEGTTVIRDAAELRVKESDRIAAIVSGLTALGASVAATEDGMVIHGGGPGFRFRGGRVDSGGDHRIAMALGVAGLRAGGPVDVAGLESATISDPAFLGTLVGLAVA